MKNKEKLNNKPPNIFIIGQCTLHWGRMEFGNIGNFYIMEPFFDELNRVFPNATIKTTFQMSITFCKKHNITCLPMDFYYGWKSNDLDIAKEEYQIALEYQKTQRLSKKTPYINEVINSDLIIDFSGDIWGDNANFLGENRFEVGLYKNLTAQTLNKKIVMLAGSPGPFNNKKTKSLAKQTFEGFDLVTVREPKSLDVLKQYDFKLNNVKSLACPAFLFKESKKINTAEIFKSVPNSKLEKPIIGFLICGWNFKNGPFDKWPRNDYDYYEFSETIKAFINKYNVRFCLMSHSNGFPIPPKKFKLIHGRDYPIIKQLEQILMAQGLSDHIFSIDTINDAWTTKKILGQFDMVVSGRVHAAVAALSQKVPTVIIDYGHKPKAHKLQGFADLVEITEYIAKPTKENLLSTMTEAWENKVAYQHHLSEKIDHVQSQAKLNFDLLKDIIQK